MPLDRFQVLVGANASGKTTFLDVVAFLGRMVSDGPEAAIADVTDDPRELLWARTGTQLELAIEAVIPEEIRAESSDRHDTVRYEVAVDVHPSIGIRRERLLLKSKRLPRAMKVEAFPRQATARETLLEMAPPGSRTVVSKIGRGVGVFKSENRGRLRTYNLGSRRSALGNLPEDETKYPVATWLKSLLADGIRRFMLSSTQLKKASPPAKARGFRSSGSNLPWVVHELERSREKEQRERLSGWVKHLRTALPDLVGLRTVERKDDRHRYLVLKYAGGLEVPSWFVSDGTLRLLALTLPAYAGLSGIYLIEEPENGIHPRAVETVYQSLSSMYNAQVLTASHSPVVLGLARPQDVLCFAKDTEGATDIVRGTEHPALKNWKKEASLSELFAGGVLG